MQVELRSLQVRLTRLEAGCSVLGDSASEALLAALSAASDSVAGVVRRVDPVRADDDDAAGDGGAVDAGSMLRVCRAALDAAERRLDRDRDAMVAWRRTQRQAAEVVEEGRRRIDAAAEVMRLAGWHVASPSRGLSAPPPPVPPGGVHGAVGGAASASGVSASVDGAGGGGAGIDGHAADGASGGGGGGGAYVASQLRLAMVEAREAVQVLQSVSARAHMQPIDDRAGRSLVVDVGALRRMTLTATDRLDALDAALALDAERKRELERLASLESKARWAPHCASGRAACCAL